MRDIFPYFAISWSLIFAHVVYMYTGKCAIIPIVFYLACPIFDMIAPDDKENISSKDEKKHFNDKRFFIPLYALAFLETVNWAWCLIVCSDIVEIDHPWFHNAKPTTSWKYFQFVFQWSYFTGISAVGGHELIHKREWYNKIIGTWQYYKFFYSHLILEHLEGHHKDVSTVEDPATALKNESLYHFLVRTYYEVHANTWKRENRKTRRRLGNDVSYLTLVLNNKLFYCMTGHVALIFLVYYFLGWSSLKYQILYGIGGYGQLELINYIEHYGILRKKDENGVYESINKFHSWNARSSPIMFRLQRHSDHHNHSFRPYQILRRFDEAPYHPFEYLHMVIIAFIPPLWFYCVNPRVDALKELSEGKKEISHQYNFYSPLSEQ